MWCLAVWFLWVVAVVSGGLPVLPPGLGCAPTLDGGLWCRGSPVSNILHAFRLLPESNDSFKLTNVDITDCQVPYLPHMLRGPVERVRLVRSQLESVYPDAFTSVLGTLRSLDLSGNKLSSVPRAVAGLLALEDLNLAHNSIAAVEPGPLFRNLAHLRTLSLAYNMLGVAAEQVRRLRANPNGPKILQLSPDLRLDQFDLRPATHTLRELDLSGNKLSSVPELLQVAVFSNLERLDLGHNFLGALPLLRAHNLPALRRLDLRKNKLRVVPFLAWPGTLQHVDLTDNPLRCDCEAAWLLESSRLINVSLPRCDAPEPANGLLLSRMAHGDLCPQESNDHVANGTGLFRYGSDGPDHRILSLSAGATSVNVTWTGDKDDASQWQLLFRRQDQDPHAMSFARRTGSTIVKSPKDNEVLHVDELVGLNPDTGYVICLAVFRGKQFLVQADKCRRVRSTPVPTTTTSTTTTTTTPAPIPASTIRSPRQKTRAVVGPTTQSPSVVATSGQIQVHPGKRRALITSLTASSDSLTLSWRMITLDREKRSHHQQGAEARVRQAHGPIRQWTIRLRPFATFQSSEETVDEDPEEESELQDTPHRGYQYTASGLMPDSAYEICLRDSTPVLQSDAMRQVPGRLQDQRELCKEVLTLPQSSVPVVIVAAAVSGTVSAIVVVAVCLGWPRCCKRKKQEDEVKMAPKDVPSSSASSQEGSSCSYINPVQYIGGQKVQVMTRECKTLPRNCSQAFIEGNNPFYSRCSLPNAGRRKAQLLGKETSPTSNAGSKRWFKTRTPPTTEEEEEAPHQVVNRGYASTIGRAADRSTERSSQTQICHPITRRSNSPEMPHYTIEYV